MKRLAFGAAIGIFAGLLLELANGFCTFLLPPFILILPSCVVLSLVIVLTTAKK